MKRRNLVQFEKKDKVRDVEEDSMVTSLFEDEEQPNMTCCLTCYRVLQLYKLRYQALVFKSDNVLDILFKLKCKLVTQWEMEDLKFLVNLYKHSKKEIDIKTEINKLSVKETRRQAVLDAFNSHRVSSSVKRSNNNSSSSKVHFYPRKSVSVFQKKKLEIKL